jgi:uncharacterized protein
MIAIDTNLLVYAHRAESEFHEDAFEFLRSVAEGVHPWAIPVACLHEFLSIVTNAKIFKPASSYEQAIGQVDAWLASPHVQIIHSGHSHWRVLAEITRKAKVSGGMFHDARIAAICIENAVDIFYSADRDFGRFKDLKCVNPLV